MIYVFKNDSILFLCFFWVNDLDSFKNLGIFFNDIFVYDVMCDLIFML